MDLEKIKKLRESSGTGIMDAKRALEEAGGSIAKAKQILQKQGAGKAGSKSARSDNSGVIETYNHLSKIGVVVEVSCETDFVARNKQFQEFAHDIALQISSQAPASVKDLLAQAFIKDERKTIEDLLNQQISTLGEKIQIKRFSRFELGLDK